ncbi:translation initiation factor IF-2-like [Panicum virgatum]|uniref:translation initiation factor IF-2-like n=1 Tax=Panicum virgatum TaxID=38727 RepID=UPI0019D5BD55|nr:translation initiation factor IF-2-like [Panicum virgatum]
MDEELNETNMTVSGVGGGDPISAKGVASMELTVGSKTLATVFEVQAARGARRPGRTPGAKAVALPGGLCPAPEGSRPRRTAAGPHAGRGGRCPGTEGSRPQRTAALEARAARELRVRERAGAAASSTIAEWGLVCGERDRIIPEGRVLAFPTICCVPRPSPSAARSPLPTDPHAPSPDSRYRAKSPTRTSGLVCTELESAGVRRALEPGRRAPRPRRPQGRGKRPPRGVRPATVRRQTGSAPGVWPGHRAPPPASWGIRRGRAARAPEGATRPACGATCVAGGFAENNCNEEEEMTWQTYCSASCIRAGGLEPYDSMQILALRAVPRSLIHREKDRNITSRIYATKRLLRNHISAAEAVAGFAAQGGGCNRACPYQEAGCCS